MLAKFLESCKELEQSGFDWALRHKGKTCNIHFVPFVMFVKGDSVEHDKHCGSCTSQTQKVQQLCRCCTCPNLDTDDPCKRYEKKTPEMTHDTTDQNDKDGLQVFPNNACQMPGAKLDLDCTMASMFMVQHQLKCHIGCNLANANTQESCFLCKQAKNQSFPNELTHLPK